MTVQANRRLRRTLPVGIAIAAALMLLAASRDSGTDSHHALAANGSEQAIPDAIRHLADSDKSFDASTAEFAGSDGQTQYWWASGSVADQKCLIAVAMDGEIWASAFDSCYSQTFLDSTVIPVTFETEWTSTSYILLVPLDAALDSFGAPIGPGIVALDGPTSIEAPQPLSALTTD